MALERSEGSIPRSIYGQFNERFNTKVDKLTFFGSTFAAISIATRPIIGEETNAVLNLVGQHQNEAILLASALISYKVSTAIIDSLQLIGRIKGRKNQPLVIEPATNAER